MIFLAFTVYLFNESRKDEYLAGWLDNLAERCVAILGKIPKHHPNE